MAEKASYYKCALQVNSFKYSKYRGKEEHNEEEYNRGIAEHCKANNICVVGLADHGSVDATDSLRKYLQSEGIVVFPGFEISTAEKIHIVCLFPTEYDNSKLNRIIGGLGLSDVEKGTEVSKQTCIDISKKVSELGGFWYAAHITGDNGILKLGKNQHIWKDDSLVAAQIPASMDEIDPKYINIIENTDPQYKREKPIAYINARDVEKPEDLDEDTSSVLVKMSSPDFESFKMAFLDPASRIKLNSDKEKAYQSSIDHIHIYGGYLDGFDLSLSENLSTIIGGRGTGKSTLINIIRYAMAKEPIGKGAKSDYKEMIKQNLGSGSRVEIKLTSNEQYGKHYSIIRRFNQESVIFDNEGKTLDINVDDIFPSIEIYGQNEIIEIARDNTRVFDIARRLLPIPTNIHDEIESSYGLLIENGKQLSAIREQREGSTTILDEVPACKEKLKFYDQAGLKEKLVIFKRLSTEEGQFDALKNLINIKAPVFPTIALEDYENAELKKLAEKIKEFNEQMISMKGKYDELIGSLNSDYERARNDWENGKYQYDDQLKASLKELPDVQDKTSQEIVDEYSKLVKTVEAAKPLAKKKKEIDDREKELLNERRNIIERLKSAYDKKDDYVAKQIKSLNRRKLGGAVKLSVKNRQNKQKLIDYITQNVDGIGDKKVSGIAEYEDFDVFTFVEDIKAGSDRIKEKYGLTNDAAEKVISGLDLEQLQKIEEILLDDIVDIELKVGDSFKKLRELSKGQQCTAILNILLLDNKDPLIIDQPEDNLDNSFIADNLVKTLRQNKIKRQYILATHNANIPVFGDAEQIITMEEKEGHGVISPSGVGSIDDDAVKKNVISILEGGRSAFKMREEKYGL